MGWQGTVLFFVNQMNSMANCCLLLAIWWPISFAPRVYQGMLSSFIIHRYPAPQFTILYIISDNFSVHACTWYCSVHVSVCTVCSAPQLSATAVSEIDTASDEVVHSITPSVVKQVWSMVQSAPTRPWWTALLPKGQSEEAILRERYIRTYTH